MSNNKQYSNSSANQDDITSIRKSLDKILKLQQQLPDINKDNENMNKMLLNYMSTQNEILTRTLDYIENSTTYLGRKKSIPYGTGIVQMQVVQLNPPANDNDYAVTINIYSQNGMKPIPQMNLVNEGPGNIFFKAVYANNTVSASEIELRPNQVRVLYNVYEIRMRTDMYLTGYRLVEEEIRTGSLSSAIKNYVETRPVLTANEKLKIFGLLFDNKETTYDPIANVYKMTIQQPVPAQIIDVRYNWPVFMTPLPRGQTATFVDYETGQHMPYTVPSGCVLEFFSYAHNVNVYVSTRIYMEMEPSTNPGVYTLINNFPLSTRGVPFQLQLNINQFSTQIVDPNGAPSTGRKIIVTLTNDDPFNSTVGNSLITAILRQIT